MFGLLKTIVYVLVIIVIGAGIFIWSYRSPLTSYGLTQLLNNPTTVHDVDLSISLARISGRVVSIENPPASQSKIKDAVRAKVLQVRLNLPSFFHKPVIIEELYFDQVDFFVDVYNVSGSRTNWKTIMYNMNAKAREKRAAGLQPKGVLIRKLIIENVTFIYRHPTLTAGSYRKLEPIPRLVLYDIGHGAPVSAAEVSTIVAQVLLKQFSTLTGITDILRGIPLLPFQLIKNIFIKKGHKTTSLEEYFQPTEQKIDEKMGLIKKLVTFFKAPQEP